MINSYKYINQNLQILIGCLHEDDELYIVRGNAAQPIEIDLGDKSSEVLDITKHTMQGDDQGCNLEECYKILNASKKTDKHLILAGDGEWGCLSYSGEDNQYIEDVLQLEKKGNIKTTILGLTESANSIRKSRLYTYCYNQAPQVNIIEAIASASSVEKAAQDAAYYIIGSDRGIIFNIDSKILELNVTLPINEFIIVTQGLNSSFEPAMQNIKAIDNRISNKEITDANREEQFAKVYRFVGANCKPIPAGKYKFEFNGELQKSSVFIIPIANVDIFTKLDTSDLRKQVNNYYYYCEDKDSVEIYINLQQFKANIANGVASQIAVTIDYDGRSYKAGFVGNGNYATKIKFNNKGILPLSATAKYQGYLNQKSNIYYLGAEKCFSASLIRVTTKLKKDKDDGGINLIDSDSNNQKINIDVSKINDNSKLIIEVNKVKLIDKDNNEVVVKVDEQFWKKYKIKVNKTPIEIDSIITRNDSIIFKFKNSQYCNCFVNVDAKEIDYSIESISTTSMLKANHQSIKVDLTIEPWYRRCKLFIFFGFLIVSAFIFLIGIFKKARFHKNGMIKVTRFDTNGNVIGKIKTITLPTNFINRWLIPFAAEKREIEGIKITATKSSVIQIDTKDLQNLDFNLNTYSAQNLPRNKKIKWAKKNTLTITNNTTKILLYDL
jgi:hypothetical protein